MESGSPDSFQFLQLRNWNSPLPWEAWCRQSQTSWTRTRRMRRKTSFFSREGGNLGEAEKRRRRMSKVTCFLLISSGGVPYRTLISSGPLKRLSAVAVDICHNLFFCFFSAQRCSLRFPSGRSGGSKKGAKNQGTRFVRLDLTAAAAAAKKGKATTAVAAAAASAAVDCTVLLPLLITKLLWTCLGKGTEMSLAELIT